MANYDDDSDLFFLDPTSLPVCGDFQFRTVYKGTLTIGVGDEVTVSAFTFNGADIGLISALTSDGKYTIVSGLEPSNIPPTGFDYAGQYLVAAIDNSLQEGGTFDLALDFENGSGTLSATSA
ncbi:hypothetical protein [Pelagovum sp. HNIBRBA483]|uniref:hypothetical protein n=1 Tax=Pelagovum sp. HNIBRBA483 TaxID=3233341 RepID=UPI0034A3FD21